MEEYGVGIRRVEEVMGFVQHGLPEKSLPLGYCSWAESEVLLNIVP